MSTNRLHAWLQRRLASRAAGCWLGAVLALAGGIGVLFLTFWFAYALLWFGEWGVSAFSELVFSQKLHLTHGWRLILCGGFVLALFIERLRRSEWEMGNYGPTTGSGVTNALVFQMGTAGALAALLANPQASATLITELLYTGPGLVLGAWQLVQAARRLARVEPTVCAEVLEYLLGHAQAVPYAELTAALPQADWQRTRADCACIPGVVLLESGLALTSDFRAELLRLSDS